MKRITILFTALLLLGLGTTATFWWTLSDYYRSPGPLTEAATVIIEPGMGLTPIANRLAEQGVIERPLLYRLGVMREQRHHRLKAGEYRFDPGVSPRDVTAMLVSGDVLTHSLTIPEGLVSEDILALIAAAPLLTGEMPATLREGELLPETYFFLRGEGRAALVERMRRKMHETLSALWKTRAEGLPLATPEDAVILASIVEKETGIRAERGRVAAVFINRLKRGMMLQSDPTTIYGIYHATGKRIQTLRTRDLKAKTLYNTYVISGLPPGPIAHPGKAALEAVLNPPATKELYFVADGTGGHRFATTLKEHNRNVAKYRKWLKNGRNHSR